MDYRAIGELIMMSLVGLSMLTFAVGFSVRLFLAPTLKDIVRQLNRGKGEDQGVLSARLDRMDQRLEALENGVYRLVAAEQFDRELVGSGDVAETEE